ncbi:hypothetical protein [Psychromonas ingrahamii]|uniref:hypothetical protein n=1 Tax=Psychromonas ingrahamii TaxID=357794 RepID=UPI0002D4EB67|nr:hypothetical protein [Psychromonas ingrahamii]
MDTVLANLYLCSWNQRPLNILINKQVFDNHAEINGGHLSGSTFMSYKKGGLSVA